MSFLVSVARTKSLNWDMSIAVVRHDPADHLGWIALTLYSRGLNWYYWHDDPSRPARALILLGGSPSAHDPNLDGEIRLIQSAVSRGLPVLGVCLGAQLIARAVGASVYPNGQKEIGWAPIRFTENAAGDQLFHALPDSQSVFHWHADTFDLPAGAVHLASSEACRNQAYRYGAKVYGLQFHLEATADIIDRWQQEDRACPTPELDHPVDARAHQEPMSKLAGIVFGRWASLISSHGEPAQLAAPQW